MRELLYKIDNQIIIFQAHAWAQAEYGNCPKGHEAAAKSRTASMELGRFLEEWRKQSVDEQGDK